MTQQEFVEKYRHEIGGMALDCLTGGNGPELSMRVRNIMRKIDALLLAAYKDAQPHQTPAVVQANGKPARTN